MFEGLTTFFKKIFKPGQADEDSSKNTAKERLHLVLMQDRANVSADFLDLMKQEIIDVIKKYIEVDEKEIDVRLTNQSNDDGTNGAPALYANIPILNIKNDVKGEKMREQAAESTKKEEVEKQDEKDEDAKADEIVEESEKKADIENTENVQDNGTIDSMDTSNMAEDDKANNIEEETAEIIEKSEESEKAQ